MERKAERRRSCGGPLRLPLRGVSVAERLECLTAALVQIQRPEGNDGEDLVLAEAYRRPAEDVVCT